MAEIEISSSLKRQREEEESNTNTTTTQEEVVVLGKQEKNDEINHHKRQKSYNDIITLLEEEEDVPNEDLSSLISTLQEEIISCSSPHSSISSSGPDQAHNPTGYGSGSSGSEEEERESVMRHLLEASDDELGLPNSNNTSNDSSYYSNVMDGFDEVVGGQVDGGDFFLPEGLWEFEDHEAANYYSMLQLEQQQSYEIFL